MSWQDRQAATYPPDEGVKIRMLTLPVGSPPRPRLARKRRPVGDCEACGSEPCKRHGYDVRASLGLAPAGSRSPDELVHDWTEVRF